MVAGLNRPIHPHSYICTNINSSVPSLLPTHESNLIYWNESIDAALHFQFHFALSALCTLHSSPISTHRPTQLVGLISINFFDWVCLSSSPIPIPFSSDFVPFDFHLFFQVDFVFISSMGIQHICSLVHKCKRHQLRMYKNQLSYQSNRKTKTLHPHIYNPHNCKKHHKYKPSWYRNHNENTSCRGNIQQ